MKFRLGACAAVVLLAACSGQTSDSQMAALHGSAGGDSLKAPAQASSPSGRDVRHSIANAPDRGALMSYQNQGKPVKRDGAFTYYPVSMSEDHALKGIVTGHMTVPMPDGSEVKLKYERHEEGIDGNWTWVGRVEGGDPMQEAIITFGEAAVFASIPQGNGRPPIGIRTRGDGLFAVEMDPTKVRSPNVGHNDMAIPEASALTDAVASQVLAAKAQVAQGAIAVAAPPTSTNTIDVVVGYTAGFRNQAALKQQSVSTALTFLLQVANQGFSNSNVNGYLRLVNAQEVSYTDSNTNQTALYELTGSNGNSNVAIPSSLAPIRTARDQYGADVALLLRGFQQPEQEGCGIAWLIGADQATVNPSQDSKWGYGVVSYGDDTGSDGNSYYCAAESMVHEVGHLLGSAHDQANSTASGRYPYSYGYSSTAGNFYTIMAYGSDGQVPYRVFSNPNIATCNNAACGVANSADNARSLNQTIPVVAQFRETVVPFGGVVSDFDGSGMSDILLRTTQSSSNNLQIMRMDGATRLGVGTYSQKTSWRVAAISDFNGDGLADILWESPATRTLTMWLSRMGGGFTGVVVGTYAAGWTVAGAGDVSGDGKSDIVLHNKQSSSRNFIVWFMNGGTKSSERVSTQTAGWNVVGVADFNGDGRADILWDQSTRRQLATWLSTSTGFTGANVGKPYKSGWSVAGTGDRNDDGRADIFLRHNQSTTVNVVVWVMSGATVAREESYVQGQSWRVASIADFNGDGKADVLWQSPRALQMTMWLSRPGTGYDGVAVGPYASGWSVIPAGH
ncbi:FG-GAP-like repeat-containing protein [Pseudomonas sp. R2.Fl]|nr:FG-GAP-like repeat-containing protein [Pseudomonas sp. R2.Fl]